MADKEPKMWPSSETRLIMPQATEEQKAAVTATRGRQAAKIKDSDERKDYIAGSANVDKDYQGTAEQTALKGKMQQTQEIMGSMKKGGTVPKTGPYKLHKGEKVIPADKVKTMASKMADATKGLGAPDKAPRAKKAIHMHIEPTDNKGFIVHHHEQENGLPTGKVKHHVFTKAGDMHKHVAKTFPMPAAEAAAPAPDAAATAAPAVAPPVAAAPAPAVA